VNDCDLLAEFFDFYLPHSHLTPSLWSDPLELSRLHIWSGKTLWLGYNLVKVAYEAEVLFNKQSLCNCDQVLMTAIKLQLTVERLLQISSRRRLWHTTIGRLTKLPNTIVLCANNFLKILNFSHQWHATQTTSTISTYSHNVYMLHQLLNGECIKHRISRQYCSLTKLCIIHQLNKPRPVCTTDSHGMNKLPPLYIILLVCMHYSKQRLVLTNPSFLQALLHPYDDIYLGIWLD